MGRLPGWEMGGSPWPAGNYSMLRHLNRYQPIALSNFLSQLMGVPAVLGMLSMISR
jgi:hypothetical protein